MPNDAARPIPAWWCRYPRCTGVAVALALLGSLAAVHVAMEPLREPHPRHVTLIADLVDTGGDVEIVNMPPIDAVECISRVIGVPIRITPEARAQLEQDDRRISFSREWVTRRWLVRSLLGALKPADYDIDNDGTSLVLIHRQELDARAIDATFWIPQLLEPAMDGRTRKSRRSHLNAKMLDHFFRQSAGTGSWDGSARLEIVESQNLLRVRNTRDNLASVEEILEVANETFGSLLPPAQTWSRAP